MRYAIAFLDRVSIRRLVCPPKLLLMLLLFAASAVSFAQGAKVLLSVNPATIQGGSNVTGNVLLSLSWYNRSGTIYLQSDNPAAIVPRTVNGSPTSNGTTFTVNTVQVLTTQVATITATYQGISATAKLTILSGQAGVLQSLTFSPSSVVGGSGSVGTIELTGPAPTGGLDVNLASSTANCQVPATVTVPAGSSSQTFDASTSTVTTPVTATVSGSAGGLTVTGQLGIQASLLQSLKLNPNEIFVGSWSTGTVTLSTPAPTGGTAVLLSSSKSFAVVPRYVLVPAKSLSASFVITTTQVSQAGQAVITAQAEGATQTATLTVDSVGVSALTLSPATVDAGQTSTGTITLNWQAPTSGLVIQLASSNPSLAQVPKTVTVASGQTSATFKITTSATSSGTAVISATANNQVTATLGVSNYYFDYPTFGNTQGLQLNGIAFQQGNSIAMTDLQYSASSSAFYTTLMDVGGFQTQFEFTMQAAIADGITFCVTTEGPGAIGVTGGDLGYAQIPNSIAIKFDLWNNVGDDANSTGIFTNGAVPFDPSFPLAPVYLASGDKMMVTVSYASADLQMTIKDEVNGNSKSYSFPIDLPSTIGSNMAYVGFTGGVGAATSHIQLWSWMFQGGLENFPRANMRLKKPARMFDIGPQ